MKKEKFIISIVCVGFLFVGLNFRFGIIPPLGKLLCPFTGYLQNAGENQLNGIRDLKGVDLNSKVYFDSRSVPHVFATNENELYYTQGYLHAKDRLWQMDFIYRLASGRLSEVVGETTLDVDKAARRKGLLWSAEQSLAFITIKDPTTLKHFEYYSEGVNAYINSLSEKDFPIEFKLLDYSPEEWSPLKTVLLQKYLADMLSGFDNDAERNNSLNFFGSNEFEKLFSRDDLFRSPMIECDSCEANFVKAKSVSLASSNGNRSMKFHSDHFQPPPTKGSNSWVVSSSKSSTGYPILASDPHLSLSSPSIWYEMQLNSGKSNCYGVSIPGIPYLIIGFNNNVAWGITNGVTDVKDWYTLKFRNDDSEYFFEGKWRKTEKRIEKIKVFGFYDVFDTILHTKIGPVVYDESFKPEQPSYVKMAMSWTGHLKSNDFKAFYLLNNASNYNDYRKAIQNIECLNINVSFASKSDIAISHTGKIPVRENNQGGLILNGNVDNAPKYIPYEYMPSEVNPGRGFVFSGNQIPVGKSYPYFFVGHYEQNRNRELFSMLNRTTKFNVSDMEKLQLSNFDIFASEIVPIMLQNLDKRKLNPIELKVYDSLSVWNYKTSKSSSGPILFYNWLNTFLETSWDEIKSNNSKTLMPSPETTFKLFANENGSKWFDIQSTSEIENGKDVLLISFKKYVRFNDSITKLYGFLNWGRAKSTRFMHLANIDAFSSKVVYCDGFINSVNATTRENGPGWRMIVEFNENGPTGWGINPAGQSGNPASKYYNDGITNWAEGKYNSLLFMKNGTQLLESNLFILR